MRGCPTACAPLIRRSSTRTCSRSSKARPLPAASLLEHPLLERLDFSEGLRARRIHDEVRILGAHAMGKEPNQSAGFQVGLNEQCARQSDTEARNGRREQQRLLAVARSLTD